MALHGAALKRLYHFSSDAVADRGPLIGFYSDA